MKEGPLTEVEEEMLLNVKDRFQQKLDEQRIPLQWLWLDLRAERAVRSLLDPPAIPSAMVIKGLRWDSSRVEVPAKRHTLEGGNSPKYALVQHDEQAKVARVGNCRNVFSSKNGKFQPAFPHLAWP